MRRLEFLKASVSNALFPLWSRAKEFPRELKIISISVNINLLLLNNIPVLFGG